MCQFLKTFNLRLVHMPEVGSVCTRRRRVPFASALTNVCNPQSCVRPVPSKFKKRGTANTTSFADGFPFLLISEESLDKLRSRVQVCAMAVPLCVRCASVDASANQQLPALDMRRFRPNIVVRGTFPNAEDRYVCVYVCVCVAGCVWLAVCMWLWLCHGHSWVRTGICVANRLRSFLAPTTQGAGVSFLEDTFYASVMGQRSDRSTSLASLTSLTSEGGASSGAESPTSRGRRASATDLAARHDETVFSDFVRVVRGCVGCSKLRCMHADCVNALNCVS